MRKQAADNIFSRGARALWNKALPVAAGAGGWYGAEKLEDVTGMPLNPEEKAVLAIMGYSLGTQGARSKFMGGDYGRAMREARQLGKEGFEPQFWKPRSRGGGWELDVQGGDLPQRLRIRPGETMADDVRRARSALSSRAGHVRDEEIYAQLKRKLGLGMFAAGGRTLRSFGETSESLKRTSGAFEQSMVGLTPQEQQEVSESLQAGENATPEQTERLKVLSKKRDRASIGSLTAATKNLAELGGKMQEATGSVQEAVDALKKSDAEIAIDYLSGDRLNSAGPITTMLGEIREVGPWKLKEHGVDPKRGPWGDWQLGWVSPEGQQRAVTFRYWQGDPEATEASRAQAMQGMAQYRKDRPTAAEQLTKPVQDLVDTLKDVAVYGSIGIGGLALLYTILKYTSGSEDKEEEQKKERPKPRRQQKAAGHG